MILDSETWVTALKKASKDLQIIGPMQYGGKFYKMCEVFGLDPDEVKKEIENE